MDLIWVLAGGKSPWRAPYLFDEKALFAVPRFRKINELVFSHPLKTSNSVPSDFGAKFPTLEAALSDRIEIEAINLGAGANATACTTLGHSDADSPAHGPSAVPQTVERRLPLNRAARLPCQD